MLKDPEEYSPLGIFVSTVLDADVSAGFETAFWEATYPAGTAVTVAVRSGNTATPDGTWTVWSSEISGDQGTAIVTDGRYWQYRLTLTTSNVFVTPSLHEIIITYMLQ